MLRCSQLLGLASFGLVLMSTASLLAQPEVLPGPVENAAPAPSMGRPAAPLPDVDRTPPQGLRGLSGDRYFSPVNIRPTSPIFMTSINYPGVYGAYYYGPAPSVWVPGLSATQMTLRPTPTTLPPSPSAEPPTEPQASPTVVAQRDIPAPVAVGQSATIFITAPEGASVSVQNQPLPSSSTALRYVTPRLRPNQLYRYEIKATWSEDGQPVTDTRDVTVQSGEVHVIGFHRKLADAATIVTPRTRD